jgi:hypothetical protein
MINLNFRLLMNEYTKNTFIINGYVTIYKLRIKSFFVPHPTDWIVTRSFALRLSNKIRISFIPPQLSTYVQLHSSCQLRNHVVLPSKLKWNFVFAERLESPVYEFFILVLRKGWAGHVARSGTRRDAQRDLVGRPEGKRQVGRTGVVGRIILTLISN